MFFFSCCKTMCYIIHTYIGFKNEIESENWLCFYYPFQALSFHEYIGDEKWFIQILHVTLRLHPNECVVCFFFGFNRFNVMKTGKNKSHRPCSAVLNCKHLTFIVRKTKLSCQWTFFYCVDTTKVYTLHCS